MNRLQFKIVGNEISVKFKLKSNEKLDTNEVKLLQTKNMGNIIVPEYRTSFFSGDCFLTNIKNARQLSVFLSEGIDVDGFLRFLSDLSNCLQFITMNNLNLCRVVLDFDGIFVLNNTDNIIFLYIPAKLDENPINVFKFYLEIIDTVKLREGNKAKIRELRDHILRYSELDYSDLQKKIYKLVTGKCIVDEGDATKIEKPGNYIDESISKNEEKYDDTVLIFNDDNKELIGLFDSVSFNDSFIVDKPSYLIGRGNSNVDYKIKNNPTVSHIHAEIIIENERFFVLDHYSSNGTKVNGKEIDPREKKEIFDGDIVSFGNADYSFRIKIS